MHLKSIAVDNFDVFSVAGVLKGRFLSLIGGCIWFDLDNHQLLTQIPCHDWAFKGYTEMFSSLNVEFFTNLASRTQNVYENLPVLTTPYTTNYFHVTVECVAGLRLLDKHHSAVAIAPGLKKFKYQDELISCCLRGKKRIEIEDFSIHKNPVLFFDYLCIEGTNYIRESVNNFAAPGNSFIYIERNSSNRPAFGGLVETQDFCNLLTYYNFKRVGFGSGEISLNNQIRMLDGARTIVSSHGAAMTNLIYMTPPLNVIELVNRPFSVRTCYEDICKYLGFNYHKIIIDECDHNGNMLMDVSILNNLLQRLN